MATHPPYSIPSQTRRWKALMNCPGYIQEIPIHSACFIVPVRHSPLDTQVRRKPVMHPGLCIDSYIIVASHGAIFPREDVMSGTDFAIIHTSKYRPYSQEDCN